MLVTAVKLLFEEETPKQARRLNEATQISLSMGRFSSSRRYTDKVPD